MPKRLSSMKALEQKLTGLSREYVFLRDRDACQWCGRLINGQLSHVIPKSRSLLLRWDEQNLKVLCAGCHMKWHKSPLESGIWFAKKFPERSKYLEANKRFQVKDFLFHLGLTRREWLQEQVEEYEQKLKGHRDVVRDR